MTYFVCRSKRRFDKRIEFLVYVMLFATAVLSQNVIFLFTGVIIIAFSVSEINFTSMIVVIVCTIFVVSSFIMSGLVKEELVNERIISESNSPDNKYSVTQIHQDAGGFDAVLVDVHREFFGCLRVSYRVEYLDEQAEVDWVDNSSFLINGERMQVRY